MGTQGAGNDDENWQLDRPEAASERAGRYPVRDANRLARPKDPLDGMMLERRLSDAGKRVVYAATGMETDRSFTSGLIGYIEHHQNGDYLRKLSRDTMRGLVERAKRGLCQAVQSPSAMTG